MANRISEKVALVSGVGRAEGIGYEICRQLARRGLTVLLTARDLGKAEPLAARLVGEGLDACPFALDVTSEDSPGRLTNEWKDDKPHGTTTIYYLNGNKYLELNYRDGQQNDMTYAFTAVAVAGGRASHFDESLRHRYFA